jgi:hypothetical protein
MYWREIFYKFYACKQNISQLAMEIKANPNKNLGNSNNETKIGSVKSK